MDVVAMMKSCDDDVVDIGSQTGPIAKEVFCLLCAQQPGFGFSRIPRFVPQNPSSKKCRELRSVAGQWNDEVCSYPPAATLWVNGFAHQNYQTNSEAIRRTIDSSVSFIIVTSSHCLNAAM